MKKELLERLPETCYAFSPAIARIIVIKRGESGYYLTDIRGGEKAADYLNSRRGITKQQSNAMLTGSMFGWNVPGVEMELNA